jgi:hypothetical protein
VPADELAGYWLHALTAAGALDSDDGLDRLVTLTLSGLRPPVRPPKSDGGALC